MSHVTTENVVDIEKPIVAGNDFSLTGNLTFDGSTKDITGATVTCSIYDERDQSSALLSDVSVTVTTPATSVVTLTLTDNGASDGTDKLHTRMDARDAVAHIADFKVVESGGAVSNSDPWRIGVRKALT